MHRKTTHFSKPGKPRSSERFNHVCNRAVRLKNCTVGGTGHPIEHAEIVLSKPGTNACSLYKRLKIASYVTKLPTLTDHFDPLQRRYCAISALPTYLPFSILPALRSVARLTRAKFSPKLHFQSVLLAHHP